MLKRIGTAIIMLAVILSCVFWLRMYSLINTDIIIMAFAIVGGYEMYRSLRKKSVNRAVIDIDSGEYKVKSFKLKPMIIPIAICMIIIYPLTYFFKELGLDATLAIGTITSLFILT
ncbi:MAG: hypothetical protein K2L47_02770, partial [Clostridia bacterium]|nr:hypothetical protein [Clostridia bacterium]